MTFTIGRVEKLRILSQASLLLPSARRFFSSPTTLQATLQIVLKSKIFCQKERSAYLFINILTSCASLVPLTPGGPTGTRHRRAGSRDRSAELKKNRRFYDRLLAIDKLLSQKPVHTIKITLCCSRVAGHRLKKGGWKNSR